MVMTKPLGELETLVMGVAWSNTALTVRQVCERLEDGRAYTTIMTTMDRLHRKGVLQRSKEGNAWSYQPALSQEDFEHALADQLAAEIVQVHGDIGLAAFVDAASASPEMLDRLEALIAARRGAA
jgi:predicted transcriptional regulator